MALKRKKGAPPLFYDVESNTLYPEESHPKKGRFNDVCRICATPATAFNNLIHIYGQNGKNLKLSAKINKFLPISVDDTDGLPHSICCNCKDVLLKMDQLYSICQNTDAYFNGQIQYVEPTETDDTEVFEVFDSGDDTYIVTTFNCDINSPDNSEPDIIGFSLVTDERSELGNTTTELGLVKEECLSDTEDISNYDIPESVDSPEDIEPIESTKPTSTHSKNKTVTVTKSGRQVKQVKKFEANDDSSATEDEGNEDSDDPDFVPEVENHSMDDCIPDHSPTYNSVTALIPKQVPFECDYCKKLLKYHSSVKSHYEKQHNMYLCPNCFIHYKTKDALIQHFKDKHPNDTESFKSKFFPCNFCDEHSCSRKQLKTHVQQEHQKSMCYRCSASFDNNSDLEEHLNSENHGNMCRICKIDFYSTELWKWHVQQHYNYDTVKVVMPTEKENLESSIDHTVNASGVPVEINEFICSIKSKENTREISVGVPSTSKAVSHSKTFPFICEFCAESLTNPTVAHDHYKKHDLLLCSYCFNNFPTATELNEHQENIHTFSCALCPFKITGQSANALKSHLSTAHGDVYAKKGVYECGICDMRSKRKAELKTHMKNVHEKLICYTCLKCFNDENSYNAHLQLEDHDYQCKVCGADFDTKRKVVHHIAFSHPNHVSEQKEKNKSEKPTYICVICNSVHHQLHFLKRHYTTLHRKFFCLLCNLVFDTHSDIDTHSLEVHGCNTSWSYKCSHCEKYFEAEDKLTLHIKTVHEKIMNKRLCEQCGRSFRTEGTLQEHVLRIHENVVTKGHEKVQCDVCSKFVQAQSLDKHMKKLHTGNKVYVCVDCGEKLFTNYQLQTHIKNNHKIEEKNVVNPGVECPHCRIKLDETRLKKHIDEEHTVEWNYTCTYCNVNCSSDTEIWQHCSTEHFVTQESNSQPFVRTSPHQCDTCLIYLANGFKLQLHKYVAHHVKNSDIATSKIQYKKDTFIVCELCGESVNKRYMYYHMYRVHNVPLKYPCDFCELSYNTEALKTKHMLRYHTEDRNIVCDLCQRAFKTKKRMRIHKKKAHFENKELPCPICGKKFKTYTSFKRHVKMHSANMPFRCETCDRGFHTKTTFKNHMSRHENNLRIYQPWKKKVEIVLPADIDPNISVNECNEFEVDSHANCSQSK